MCATALPDASRDVAAFVGLGYEFLSRFMRPAGAHPDRFAGVVSYASVWRKRPICLREARANGQARMFFDQAVARELEKLPDRSNFDDVLRWASGGIQDAGIPFRRVLNEGNHPQWTLGLADPAACSGLHHCF